MNIVIAGYMKPKQSKPVKRCSPTQQLPRTMPSCKMKITRPTSKKSEQTAAAATEVKIKDEQSESKLNDKETKAKETNRVKNGSQKIREDGSDPTAHSMETTARPKTGKSTTKTSKSKPHIKLGNTQKAKQLDERRPVEVKTRTRTIIPVKFTSL